MTPVFLLRLLRSRPGIPWSGTPIEISQEFQVHATYSLAVRGIVAAIALAVLAGCQKSQPQAPAMPPPEVTVAVVQPQDLPVHF